jgi:hypothetical protein
MSRGARSSLWTKPDMTGTLSQASSHAQVERYFWKKNSGVSILIALTWILIGLG